MNSDFFNINRFGRYLVTDIRNAIARYGISLLVMASISIAGYLLAGFFSMFLGLYNQLLFQSTLHIFFSFYD